MEIPQPMSHAVLLTSVCCRCAGRFRYVVFPSGCRLFRRPPADHFDVAYPTNRDQLQEAPCRGSPSVHDDDVGLGRSTPGRLQQCRGFQHCIAYTARDPHFPQPSDLGTVPLLPEGDVTTLLPRLSTCALIVAQRMTTLRAVLIVAANVLVMAATEAALIVGLRILKSRHVEWPMTLMAVLSACLLAAGVLQHYWDIWIHRTVRGISFIFVGIDAAGDVFSLVSIFFQPSLDPKGMAIYATEFLLWCGIFACGGYYNFLPWLQRKWSGRISQDVGSAAPITTPPRGDVPQDGHGSTQLVVLHDNPSSTSVFSTPPGAGFVSRARTGVNMARGSDGEEASA